MQSCKNLFLYFFASGYSRVDSPKAFGMELGNILWMVLYP